MNGLRCHPSGNLFALRISVIKFQALGDAGEKFKIGTYGGGGGTGCSCWLGLIMFLCLPFLNCELGIQ